MSRRYRGPEEPETENGDDDLTEVEPEDEEDEPDEDVDTSDEDSDADALDPPESDAEGELEVHFIDAGQADATLLDGPDFNVLVDAGHWFGDEVVDFLEEEAIEELDLLLITHPHADHMGEADEVIQDFEVQEVWMSGDTATSQTFEDVVDAVEASDADTTNPEQVKCSSLIVCV